MKYKPHTVNQKDTIQYDNMLWEIKISNSIILKKPTPQKIGLSEYSEDYLDPIGYPFYFIKYIYFILYYYLFKKS